MYFRASFLWQAALQIILYQSNIMIFGLLEFNSLESLPMHVVGICVLSVKN